MCTHTPCQHHRHFRGYPNMTTIPKHDNNAQVRMCIKEVPVLQGLLKGFRHYKTGPGQDGSFQKAPESTMSLQYVHTFHTTVSSLSCYEIDTGVLT